MNASTGLVPENFYVERITVPISLHYSRSDLITTSADINKLIPMLSGTSDLYVQEIDDFNHLDFALSERAAELVYSKILCFFDKYMPL